MLHSKAWWRDRQWSAFNLPKDLSRFASSKKDVSPFDHFHLWAAKKIGPTPTGKVISVSAVWLHEQDAKKLSKLTYDWICKFHYPTKIYKVAAAQQALALLNLDVGPSSFREDALPPGIESGKVFIEVDSLFITKTELQD